MLALVPFDLAVLLQQRVEVGERCVHRLRSAFGLSRARAWPIQVPLVLVVVAVKAEQFPVAAVGQVVVVVVVLVVDRELPHVGVIELTRTAAADPRIQLQRLAAITLLARLLGASCVGDDAIEALEVGAMPLLPVGH